MSITREEIESGSFVFTDPDIDVNGPRIGPIHPGEILWEDFMLPLKLTAYRLGHALHVPVNRISEIVHGRRSITADTALRLGRYFKTSARLWLGLQETYDLEVAEQVSGAEIIRIINPYAETVEWKEQTTDVS
jgi:addiction module HigA family antidote